MEFDLKIISEHVNIKIWIKLKLECQNKMAFITHFNDGFSTLLVLVSLVLNGVCSWIIMQKYIFTIQYNKIDLQTLNFFFDIIWLLLLWQIANSTREDVLKKVKKLNKNLTKIKVSESQIKFKV